MCIRDRNNNWNPFSDGLQFRGPIYNILHDGILPLERGVNNYY